MKEMRGIAPILGFAVSLGAAVLGAGPPPLAGAEGPVVYELDVRFEPAAASLAGQASITLPAGMAGEDSVVFYLHGELRATAVAAGGRPLSVSQDTTRYYHDYSLVANRVAVAVPDGWDGTLDIRWEGRCSPSSARTPSDYMRIDSSGVYLRSYGYSLWFPVFAESGAEPYDAAFPRVLLRTPPNFTTVFVGERLEEDTGGDGRVSSWRCDPIPVHRVQCAAARFAVHRDGPRFIYSRRDEGSRRAAPAIAGFVDRFVGRCRALYRPGAVGGQVHIVQMPRYGDISSLNMVGLSEESWLRFGEMSRPRRVLAHELVHPFVQAVAPPGDPLRAMAIEGFPAWCHLPVLAELAGESFYDEALDAVQRGYIEKRRTGTDRRGAALPPEKPLTSIGDDEIGRYKDLFVLSDRALLFLDWLRREAGPAGFPALARDIFERETLDYARFTRIVLDHLPGAAGDLRIWLETSDYPERFRRPAAEPGE